MRRSAALIVGMATAGLAAVLQAPPVARARRRRDMADDDDAALAAECAVVLHTAIAKLKAGMDGGPFGEAVLLEPNEATILYRLIECRTGLIR